MLHKTAWIDKKVSNFQSTSKFDINYLGHQRSTTS